MDLTVSPRVVERKFGLHAAENVVSVPDLPELLDQVAAASAPNLYGARVDFSWETSPTWIRDQLRDDFARENEQRDADEARRRAAGQQVARRSRYFDGVTAPDEPTVFCERVPQKWGARASARRGKNSAQRRNDAVDRTGSSPGASAQRRAATPVVLYRSATHQVVNRASVTLSSRSEADRTNATSSYLHDLRVRLEAGSAECVIEVHYILEEDLVGTMSDGQFSFREGCNTTAFDKPKTWLDDIPDAISMPGVAQEDFRKVIDLPLPGTTEADATARDNQSLEDLFVLREALRFHGGLGADVAGAGTGDAKWQLVGVAMTRKFKRAVEVSSAASVREHHHHQLRWLQLTHFGRDAWNTDDSHGDLTEFYSDDDDDEDGGDSSG